MGIFICNMRMQSLYDSRGEKLVLYSILSWLHVRCGSQFRFDPFVISVRYYTWYLKRELATRRAVTVTQVSRNFYQTIRAARHCPWELCADTSHSFPESRLSMSTEKAFGSSYWSIKSYKKYDSYREPIQMLIYLARIILSNTRINIIFY